ncbi:MAG: hypothetical protein CMG75_02460 [Candidatus Marinimicrobia bacterium]|nr:hypothetical protein [Candidatus Neomarinimicrobiota bacterium]
MDLLVLGHRKMSTFKSRIMDTIDEGIINHVQCPVLVARKLWNNFYDCYLRLLFKQSNTINIV